MQSVLPTVRDASDSSPAPSIKPRRLRFSPDSVHFSHAQTRLPFEWLKTDCRPALEHHLLASHRPGTSHFYLTLSLSLFLYLFLSSLYFSHHNGAVTIENIDSWKSWNKKRIV